MTDPAQKTAAYGLTAAGQRNALGISNPQPALAWKLEGKQPASVRIQGVSALERFLEPEADLFDLVVSGDDASSIAWPGEPMSSRQVVWWRVVPEEGEPSTAHRIEAPLWSPAEWEATSITAPEWVSTISADSAESVAFPEIERRFLLAGEVASARLYLTGNGVIVPTINSERAIEAELEPGYSRESVCSPATTWDVTAHLRSGDNAIRFSLGGGISHLPALADRYTKFVRTGTPWVRARLEIQLTDGQTVTVVTNESWRSRLGSAMVAHWYGGMSTDEHHQTPWVRAAALDVTATPRWRGAPSIRRVEAKKAVQVQHHTDGSRLYDFGINSAGRPRLRLADAQPGWQITLTPSELLHDGQPDQSTTGTPIWDSLIPAAPDVDWAPELVYHGGRYLRVQGLSPSEPDDAVTWEILRADNAHHGSFRSSDSFFTSLHTIIDRAVQSNMFSVFTDCPHREKLGWVEQLYLCFDTLARGYDVHAHLSDTVGHMLDAQTPAGLIPTTAPELVVFNDYPIKGDITAFRDDVNWGRAIIELPWRLYRFYGDKDNLRRALPAAVDYLAYLKSRAADGVLDFGLGDWIAIDDDTPRSLVATHGWLSALQTTAKAAEVLGEADIARRILGELSEVAASFTKHFQDAESRVWGNGSQASWALAATAPGVEHLDFSDVVDGLLESIHASGDTLTVGENALPSLIETLTAAGHGDVLNALIRREDAPGYGYQIRSGATALTESWTGPQGNVGVASQNHFMLGMIDSWLTGHVAGLRQHDNSVAWRRAVIAPVFLDGINDAATVFESPQGRTSVSWIRSAEGIELTIEIPPGTTADLVLPAEQRRLGPGVHHLTSTLDRSET